MIDDRSYDVGADPYWLLAVPSSRGTAQGPDTALTRSVETVDEDGGGPLLASSGLAPR